MAEQDEKVTLENAASKHNEKKRYLLILAVIVLLGAVIGMMFIQQQRKHRQDVLENLLMRISQSEFAETEELYSSLDERTRQFVQSEVMQSLVEKGIEWLSDQSEPIMNSSSQDAFDKLHELKNLAEAVGAQPLIPLTDKALELEKYVPFKAFLEILSDDSTNEADEKLAEAFNMFSIGALDANTLATNLKESAKIYDAAASKAMNLGLAEYRVGEVYELYIQLSENYTLMAQAIENNDMTLYDQTTANVLQNIDAQQKMLEDVAYVHEERSRILNEMLAMIESIAEEFSIDITSPTYAAASDVEDNVSDDELSSGEYWCMGKGDTCQNRTYSPYDLYCSACDPNEDNIEG